MPSPVSWPVSVAEIQSNGSNFPNDTETPGSSRPWRSGEERAKFTSLFSLVTELQHEHRSACRLSQRILESQAHISTHASILHSQEWDAHSWATCSSGKRPGLEPRCGAWLLTPSANRVLGGVGSRERVDWEGFDGGVPPLKVVSQVRSQVLIHDSHVLLVEWLTLWYSSPAKVYFMPDNRMRWLSPALYPCGNLILL